MPTSDFSRTISKKRQCLLSGGNQGRISFLSGEIKNDNTYIIPNGSRIHNRRVNSALLRYSRYINISEAKENKNKNVFCNNFFFDRVAMKGHSGLIDDTFLSYFSYIIEETK